MKRTAFAALLVVASAGPIRADTLPLILAPAEYTPGTPFSFEIRVPDVVDFSSYSIDVIIGTTVLNPDLGFVATQPGLADYPFGSTANQEVTFSAVGNSFDRHLHLADSTGSPVATTGGVNDLLLTVQVTPGANVSGPITIAVNGDTLDISIGGEPPPDVVAPNPLTIAPAAGPPPGGEVPTPAAWVSLAIGGLILAARRRLLKPTA